MANISTTKANIIFNKYTTTYWMYYSKTNNEFFFYDAEMESPAHESWIPLPFEEDCKRLTWKIFYENLSESDLALVQSYDGEDGFFAFMRSNHLIDIYSNAWSSAWEQKINAWEKCSSLTINWETATIRYF